MLFSLWCSFLFVCKFVVFVLSVICRVIVMFHLAIGTCCGFYGLLIVYGVTCNQTFGQVVVYITMFPSSLACFMKWDVGFTVPLVITLHQLFTLRVLAKYNYHITVTV